MNPLASSRRTLLLWALGLALLAGAALGLPPLFFALTDRADFSALDIRQISQTEEVYAPANADQVLQMIQDNQYTPIAQENSPEQVLADAQACLRDFAQKTPDSFGGLFQILFLDPYGEEPVAIASQSLAGVGVFEDSVRTSTLEMAVLETNYTIPGDTENHVLDLALFYDPSDLTLYAFTLSGIPKNFFAPDWLDGALEEYLLAYLGADPADLDPPEGQESDVYRGTFGSFLPPEGSDYRAYIGNSHIYWDGTTLSVNLD